jgi:ATP-dependent Clp protease protease subunit
MKDKSKKKKNKTKKKKKELDIEVKDAAQVKEGDLDDKQIVIINNIQSPDAEMPELRTMSLYGDITEQKGSEVVAGLLFLESSALRAGLADPNDPESDPVVFSKSINMFISTHGGCASDMFSILDVMEMVKNRTCDIETTGIGKVMSAGVPILAAGTKGKRKVGKNCRIMLHNVMAGAGGTIFNMENELEEIKWVQDRYIETLASYTKMTKAKIKKMLKTQRDVYISAEEAINLGIADEII